MACKLHNIRFYNCEPKAIYCMAIEYGSKILALSRSDAHIELWDVKNIPCMIRIIPGTPNGSVEALCWVDGRLFSTGLSGAVVEWDIKTLSPKQSVLVTGQAAWCIDFTKTLKKIAVGTEQGYINIYSVHNGAVDFDRIFDKQEGRILCCKFDPSGQTLVTGSIETIRIWNVSTGQALHRMGTGRIEKNKETIVWCLAVTSDLTIISGDSRGRLTFWDGNMGEQLESMTTHKCDILSVCLTEDESSVYCAGVDPLIVSVAKVRIKCKSDQGHVDKWVKSIKRNIHSHDVRAMVSYKDKLFSGGVDSYLAVSSYPPKVLMKYSPMQHTIAKFSAKAKLVCLRYVSHLEIWKLGSAKSDKDGESCTYIMDEENSSSPVKSIISNGELENGDSRDDVKRKMKRLQLSEGADMLIKLNTSSSATLTCCDLSPDAQWVAYSTDTHLRIFQLTMEKGSPVLNKLSDLPEECTPCYKMSFTPDSSSLITVTADSTVKIFKLDKSNSITCAHTISASKVLTDASLVYMYVSDTIDRGYYIVLADTDGNVAVWKRLYKGKDAPSIVAKLPKHHSVPTCMAIDSNSNLIVTYTDQKIIEYNLKESRLTEFSSNAQGREFGLGSKWNSRSFPITSIQFHPRKTHLILMSDDSGLYAINKNVEQKKNVSKKQKMQNGDIHPKISFTTIKKIKHVIASQWISEDEAALVIVDPDSLAEKLPPAFVKARFGVL